MAELEELKFMIEDAKREWANSEGATRMAMAEGIQSLEQRYDALCAERDKQRALAEEEALSESPIGRLMYAVADAMQYDHLYAEDLARVINEVNQRLGRENLEVLVIEKNTGASKGGSDSE